MHYRWNILICMLMLLLKSDNQEKYCINKCKKTLHSSKKLCSITKCVNCDLKEKLFSENRHCFRILIGPRIYYNKW